MIWAILMLYLVATVQWVMMLAAMCGRRAPRPGGGRG
jgi:hypothetical protein